MDCRDVKANKLKVNSHVKSSNYNMWQIILLSGGEIGLERKQQCSRN